MKALITVLATVALAVSANATELEIVVQGVQSTKGLILVGAYADAASFLKSPKMSQAAPAVSPVTVIKGSVPEGRYAFSVFQDENRNGKFDTDKHGIPVEPYGFSGVADASSGKPSFDAVAVQVKGRTQRITIPVQ